MVGTMLFYFVTIAVLGTMHITKHPSVMVEMLNPFNAVQFYLSEPLRAFIAMGSVVLSVTGAEALYADMENNIGIAYGAIIEDAKGGEGNDRINGNWETNHFWGNGGADTFIIADYDGTTLAGDVRVDNSVDVIEDFNSGEGDKISLSTLNVEWSDLSFTPVEGGTLVTVERGADDLSVIVLGAAPPAETDFIF